MSTIQHRLMVDRRRILQGAALAAAALPLAACGKSGGSTADSSTIKILDYYADDPDNGIFQKVLEECAAKVGVTVERESVNGTGLIQKVLQMSSSKTLPDLLMLDNPDLQQIAATGALAPLSDFGIAAEGFIEGFVSAGTYQDKLYGMGPCANTIGLYYNQDMLSAAGVSVPTTWDELKTAAKTLTSGDTYGIAFCAAASYEGSWQFLPFFWSNGADETDIASSAAAGALQLWVDLVNEGSASSGVLELGAGRRRRAVHLRQGRHGHQRAVADHHLRPVRYQLGGRGDPGAQGRRHPDRAAGRRGVDGSPDGQQGPPGQGRRAPDRAALGLQAVEPQHRALHDPHQLPGR